MSCRWRRSGNISRHGDGTDHRLRAGQTGNRGIDATFPAHYMEDLQRGAYRLPPHTEQSLRHVFTMGAVKEYFYENMPSISNPLGLGHKAMPLACKVQNLLIADFLHYLALRHGVYLSTMGGDVKKNSTTKP